MSTDVEDKVDIDYTVVLLSCIHGLHVYTMVIKLQVFEHTSSFTKYEIISSNNKNGLLRNDFLLSYKHLIV